MNFELAPHKSGKMLDRSRKMRLPIPSILKQVEILNEINATLVQLGHEKSLSKSFW